MGRPKDVRAIPPRVGKTEACRLVGLGDQKFSAMVERGEMPRAIDGGWDPVEIVAAMVFYVSEGGVRTRLDEARIRKLQNENARAEGEYLHVDDVRTWFAEAFTALDTNWASIPGQLTIRLAGITDDAVTKQVCKEVIADARKRAVDGFLEHLGPAHRGHAGNGSARPNPHTPDQDA